MSAEIQAGAGTRVEHDSLGERRIDADAYFGINTLRALENFPIAGIPISRYPDLIDGLAIVKEAAAGANRELGLLDGRKAGAVATACQEIRGGALHDQFVVDVLQGGAGTSTNMNANEVIANRGLEILGHHRGEYTQLHPLDDVNLCQSTNDAYPTAAKIGLRAASTKLHGAMEELGRAFATKSVEFADILKMGRTQLQDAVPMTLGDEFRAYAIMVEEDCQRLVEARRLLGEVSLGGTAIGTGLNAPPEYPALACARLRELAGDGIVVSVHLVEATQDAGVFVQLSAILKRIAVKLSKVCNDLRLLSSGPRTGLAELRLPPRQAGSSIMPGKVNPVIPEMFNQVAFRVIGNDITVTMAAEAGQLQLNAFEPVMVHCLFESIALLRRGCETLSRLCIEGIVADHRQIGEYVERSVGMATALSPRLGYERASALASEALRSDRTVDELVVAHGLMTRDELDALLEQWTHPRAVAADVPAAG